MTQEPGEHLAKFYDLYDTESHTFDGHLQLKGILKAFADDTDIHDLLNHMGQHILDRFSDLDKEPLSLMRVFDFRYWPHTLTELSTHGNTEIKSLCLQCSDVLSEDEVKLIPYEWQTLKVQVSMQRQYHPLTVYSSILQRKEESVKNIGVLISLVLTISPSTASCERLFSSMNMLKSSIRTHLTQENLQNQIRIVVSGKPLEDYDPLPAVQS